MSTQPSTPDDNDPGPVHPDPDAPWLDLTNGIPDWVAEYKMSQPALTMRSLYDSVLPGTIIMAMHPKDVRVIIEELIRYREAYHAARRDEMTRLTQVLDANDAVKNSLRQERDYARNDANARLREIFTLRAERDALLRAAAAMEREAHPLVELAEKAIFVPGSTGWIEGYFVEDELVKYVGTLRSQLDELRPRVHNLEAANTALTVQCAEKIASLEAQVHQLDREPLIKPTASERVQLLEIDLASAHRSIETLKSERDIAINTMKGLRKQAGQMRDSLGFSSARTRDRLMESVNRQGEVIVRLTAKVDELVETLAQVTAEREQAWAENATLNVDMAKQAARLNTRIVELETTMQQGAIKLRGVVDQVQARQARQAPIEPWGLVRDPEEDEPVLVAPPEMKLYDGLMEESLAVVTDDEVAAFDERIGKPREFTASREESQVKFIDPEKLAESMVKLRDDVYPAPLSVDAIRNFQATVRSGPALTRTYSIHGSDDAKIEVLPIGCELPEYPEYEHKVFNWLSEDEFRAKLKEMGEQGWKLISHHIDIEGTITHYCVFGRKS